MEIKKVGVVGAGVMGVGLGQNLAQSGLEAVLVDISDEVLDHARAEIKRNLRFQGMLQKGSAPKEDSATVLGRIHFTTLLEDLADVDFLVENVPEKWEIKSKIYPRIDKICPEHTVFAVNTSCYSITRVGALTQRPDRPDIPTDHAVNYCSSVAVTVRVTIDRAVEATMASRAKVPSTA